MIPDTKDRAVNAREEKAFCPYSDFAVGAALRHSDGRVITAGNVELKPTVVGVHAEQLAVAKALERGWSEVDSMVIALAADQPPCGVCLQALASINPGLDMRVGTYNTETDELRMDTLEELLPEAYTPSVRHE